MAQNAQSTEPIISTSTMSTPLSVSNTRPPTSLITSFISYTSSNATITTSSSSPSVNEAPPPLGIPPAGGSGGTDIARSRNESVFNYYFLFLAVFGVLVALCLWWVHKRRKKRKEMMRQSGQNALARDLDGWTNTRRWMHGRWRHNQTGFVRREEGLDENGEAPPPYQPKSDITVDQSNIRATHDTASGLTIPLRTLSRDEINTIRLPDYQESEQRINSVSGQPRTARTHTTPLETANDHSNTSTRNLIRNERDLFNR
ncbi:hypothetical protein CC78DRAFT_547422 [Lojkania enalia]|uniref:Uncharacterized protein n=1 Tax=Lojkania enalia TaxID=147567 RepID=A0A9P4K6Y1_9PLEO|nr:hypothetical protein CC78DRAFT_547422 [Didymosphaeria enalia]